GNAIYMNETKLALFIPILLFLVIIVIAGGFITIKNRLYSQFLLAICGIASIVCGFAGINRLNSHHSETELVGAILLGIAIFSMLGIAVTTKLLFQRRAKDANKTVQETGTVPRDDQ
ncbi:MAG: hypothetical protein ACFCU4_04555, partial [Puniceicoccaceae bacterium]